ncbi:MAG TPA: hypothetical protein VFY20_03450, partial [Gemmatimonadales bacterium]|nr:hypothetical protein [Gemmatimonadales bacterium]
MVHRIVPPFAGMLAVLSLSFAPSLTAQEQASTAPEPAAATARESYPPTLTAPAASLDTFLVLVPVRPASVITDDIAEFRTLQQRARDEGARAEVLQQRVEERMRLVKAGKDNYDARAGAAKKLDDAPTEQAATAGKKAAEVRVKHLEQRRELRAAEIDMAEAHERAAGAVVQSLQKELALEQRRAAAATGAESGAVDVAQGETAIAALELQVLEAQREAVRQRE